MIITEWDPPRRCVVRHTGRVVRGDGIFEVIPHGELTEFRWTELIDLPVPDSVRPAATRDRGPVDRGAADQAGPGLRALRRFARLV